MGEEEGPSPPCTQCIQERTQSNVGRSPFDHPDAFDHPVKRGAVNAGSIPPPRAPYAKR